MVQEQNSFVEEYPALKTEKILPTISLYIKTDSLEEMYKQLKPLIYSKMNVTFYGSKEFAILDNNGYVLTFSESNN